MFSGWSPPVLGLEPWLPLNLLAGSLRIVINVREAKKGACAVYFFPRPNSGRWHRFRHWPAARPPPPLVEHANPPTRKHATPGRLRNAPPWIRPKPKQEIIILRFKKTWPALALALKGVPQKRPSFLLIISICRLEATADADGDIGRSSKLTIRKRSIYIFSELYWSSFLGSVQKKNVTETKRPVRNKCVCMFSHGKRTSARKSAFHHKVANNDRYSFLWRRVTNGFRGA